ncbi:MAG: hypothetical protein AAGG09_17370 [Pseudomonadota bacterium]
MDDDDRILAYVQGALGGEARAAFEREMAERPALRAEVSALAAAQSVFAEDQEDAAAAEAGWERLSRSIAAEPAPALGTAPAPANLNRRPMLLQFAAVAIGAVVLWQVLAVPYLPGPERAGFAPVSEAPAEIALRVGFAEGARVADLNALLDEIGARIVDGPGALGLFTLAFDDAAAREAAEALLTERTDLVRVVSRP